MSKETEYAERANRLADEIQSFLEDDETIGRWRKLDTYPVTADLIREWAKDMQTHKVSTCETCGLEIYETNEEDPECSNHEKAIIIDPSTHQVHRVLTRDF